MALLNRPPQSAETGEQSLSLQCSATQGGFHVLRLLWLGVCLLCCSNLAAQVFKEYDLKALFLYNFAQFVDWPAEAFPSPGTPLVIGVLGQDHFGKSLDDLIESQKASAPDRGRSQPGAARKLKIERSRRFTDLQNCHILFIDQSESANLDEILRKCRGKPILTVSDIEGFSRRGGIIEFITDEKA